jgi:hypothetical protein
MTTRARKISPHHPPIKPSVPISNRSAPRLEMPESYTKQRTDPPSNRHKFTHFRPRSAWSSVARRLFSRHPRVTPGLASSSAHNRSDFAAGLTKLVTPSESLPLVVAPLRPRTACAAGYSTLSRRIALVRISNRHLVRLECDVTSRKQTEGAHSNRHQMTFCSTQPARILRATDKGLSESELTCRWAGCYQLCSEFSYSCGVRAENFCIINRKFCALGRYRDAPFAAQRASCAARQTRWEDWV